MFITGLLIFLNLLVFSDFTAIKNAAMDIFEFYIHCTQFQSRYHCLEKDKRKPEHGYQIYRTAELKGPKKRCQVWKEISNNSFNDIYLTCIIE